MMHEGRVVCYELRKLNEHDRNYVAHHLELENIIHALKPWRHYLLGKRFKLMSDHSGMRYLFDQPNLNAIQARWLDTPNEFDFEIRYIKGKVNRVEDTLSRRVQGEGDRDEEDHLTINGLVRFRNMICVLDNSEPKKLILREFHVKLYSGHLGYQKTLTTLKKFYHWLNLKKEVAEFVARCMDSQ
eukprot:PITA_30047